MTIALCFRELAAAGRALGWVIAAAVLVSAAGCSAGGDESLLASAQQRLAKQDVAGAIIDAKNLIQKKPELPAARHVLGKALLALGDLPAAEIELERAQKLGHPEHEVLPALAELALAKREPAAVIRQFEGKRLDNDSGAAALDTHLARAHFDLGDNAKAQARLAEALKRVPQFAPALELQASMAIAREDLGEARRITSALLARSPDSASAWLIQGRLLVAEGKDLAAAQQAFGKAISLNARLADAHAALITLLVRQRDFKATGVAAQAMQKALPALPASLYYQGIARFLLNDLAGAREHLQSLLARGADHPGVLLLAGMVESRLGALTQAQALLAKVVQSHPEALAPQVELADVYLRLGQWERALATLEKPMASNLDDAGLWRSAGQAYAAAGDFKRADEAFARALRLNPDDAAARVNAGRSLIQRGSVEIGLRELQLAASADTQSPAAELELVTAHIRRKDINAALAVTESIAKKLPDLPVADHLRGRIYLSAGDTAAARKAFEQALVKMPSYFPAAQSLAELDIEAQQPKVAKRRYEVLLKRDGRSAPAMLALADLARRMGREREESTAWVSKAVAVDPQDAKVWRSAIEFHRADGDPVAALARARSAAAAMPNQPELLLLLADSQLAEGDVQHATATLNRIAELRPNAADLQLRLMDAHLAAKRPDRARTHAAKALALEPLWPPALRAVIGMAFVDGKPEQGLDVARNVQKGKPEASLGWQLEGEVEFRRGQWEASAAALRMALSKGGGTDVAVLLASALQRGGRSAEVAPLVEDWLREHPKDSDFIAQLGHEAAFAGDWPRAEARYRQALAMQPNSAHLLNNLAYALGRQKKPEALELAQRATQLVPHDPALLETLAYAYAATNQIDKAIEWQEKVVALAPRDGGFRLSLARYQLAAGQKSKARDELQRLQKLGDSFPGQPEVKKLLQQSR